MKQFLLTAAIVAALVSCQRNPSLVILHTNDTHSHLEPERGGRMAGFGGAIERAAFVDSVRQAMGEENVLLLHAGDFNQGSSYFSELGGKVEVNVVNSLRYDCITIGNHEFDNGLEDLSRRLARVNSEIVCANLSFQNSALSERIKPYVVLERGGKKIGIIGVAPAIKSVVIKSIADCIDQKDAVPVVNEYAGLLKAEGCDLIILLSHMGYDEDLEIVPHTAHLDLIVGGHSHTFVDEMKYVKDSLGRKVGVVTDGCWGLEMGEIKVY